MRGKSHEYEPEESALFYIDFKGEAPDAPDVRYAWTIDMVARVLWEVHGGQANTRLNLKDLATALVVAHTTGKNTYDLDEVRLWEAIERYANAYRFDTYTSNMRFEVYPGETSEAFHKS